MSEDPKNASETMADSAYDQRSGHSAQGMSVKPQGLAISLRDTSTGRVEETPGGPSNRPGTEAEEAADDDTRRIRAPQDASGGLR